MLPLFAQITDNTADLNEIKLVNLPKPKVKDGHALVKIHSASMNPIDYKVMEGHLKGAGWAMPLPFTLGYDLSGVVEEIQGDHGGFCMGDEVFAVNWGVGKHDNGEDPVGGAFAEYIAMPMSKLSKKPKGLSHDQAAAVALVGTTAYQGLFDSCQVKAGQKVLVLGGAGAVGAIAIQLAKNAGATVVTTCSPRTKAYVESFGAVDQYIDYRSEKWEEVLKKDGGVDAVFDTVGEEGAFEKAKGIVKKGGAFCTIASFDAGFDPKGHEPAFSFASFMCLSNSAEVQDKLAQMMVDGKLKVTVEKSFKFTEEGIRKMFEVQKGGKSTGKNVLSVVV